MAEDIGVSAPLISQISGGDMPGERLIQAMKKSKKVSPAWLEDGVGPAPTSGEVAHVPIARAPLPGDPRSHPDLLSGDYFSVAKEHFSEDRYFLEINPRSGLVEHAHRGLRAYDLLLFDTQLAKKGIEQVDRRICIVSLSTAAAPSLRVGIVNFHPAANDSSAELIVEMYDEMPPRSAIKVVKRQRASGSPIKQYVDRNTGKPIGRGRVEPAQTPIKLKDIRGVGVMMIRRQP